jgi:ubiquinone biosynthesis protein
VRLRLALEDGGVMFVKLGQVLSTRGDLLPPSFVCELSRLQDNVRPAPAEAIELELTAELGAPVAEVFAEFQWRPVASASIGQVYRGRLRSGEPVVVKVQRPGIAAAVERDLGVLAKLARVLEARASWAYENRVVDLADEFAAGLREELDFRHEAQNAVDIARDMTAVSGMKVPHVYRDHTTSRVLVMEWLDGVSVREVERIDGMGLDRGHLAEVLLRGALHQMLISGQFHADPHPGNVLVLPDGMVGLIDFGAVGRIDPHEQGALQHMMIAVAMEDETLLRDGILEVASVNEGFNDDQFERALGRFMVTHLGPGARPSAAMLNDLLHILLGYSVVLPAEFGTLFRALATLEGTLTTLDPDYDVIDAARSISIESSKRRFEPSGLAALAKTEAARIVPVLARLPRHVDRLATIVERGDLHARVSVFSEAEDVRTITRLVNRALLAFIGGAVVVASVVLIGIKGGPAFTSATTLYQFLGYFGLACGSVLVMRVLVAIFREGMN